jgi:hypothetical protein
MLIKRLDRIVRAVGQKPTSRADDWPNSPLIQPDECHPQKRDTKSLHGHPLVGGDAIKPLVAFSKSA